MSDESLRGRDDRRGAKHSSLITHCTLLLRYYLPLALWIAVIFVFSSGLFSAQGTGNLIEMVFADVGMLLSPRASAILNFVARKSAHVIAYATLGALAVRAMAEGRRGWVWRWGWMALAIAAVVAILDEWHQSTIPTRTGSVWDVLLDLGAAALAVGLIGGRKSRMLSFPTP